jgi:hypothetical protein
MKRIIATFLIAGLAAAPAQAAMQLSAQDLGQVLLFPYYTVQRNQTTVVGIVNTTDQAKALNVQFREARNGNVVTEITLLLGPHDSWSASVVALPLSSAAYLTTSDRSCTMPYVFNAPIQVNGRSFHVFENTAATTPDGGPTTPDRTREGYLQVVELGEIAPSSALHAQLSSPLGSPSAADCDTLSLAADDLVPPTGGLYGAFGIVDAATGTSMAGIATAIEDFSRRALWSPIERAFYLGAGYHDSRVIGHVRFPVTHAQVSIGGNPVTLGYDDYGRSRTDAVSALLMADAVYGGFAGTATTWVITSPTKHHYVNPTLVSGVRPPYREAFSATTPGQSCMPYRVAAYYGDQRPLAADTAARRLCHSVDVISFAPPSAGAALGSSVAQSLWSFTQGESGALQLMPGSDTDGSTSASQSALDGGPALRGLPVIGFEAVRQLGRNPPGVIASYAYTAPLRSRTQCADATGAAIACP